MAKQHSPRFLQLVAEARSRIRECTVEDVRRRIEAGERFVLIDVREESEYAAGHAVGAIHLSKGVIERDIESKFPDPQTPLVLYCGGGYRSALAADNLQKMGYTNVVSMEGGWRAWVQAGLPVEHGTAPTNTSG
ncbi:MAG: rhodanese-like domain-containing protein [Gemmataceae bacterium]|jgi:rhodanese-related sulfurtransferase|uniref:Sulfurtransferase n=1 Tax=Thermogemmata fonticola TaxID=2755323 RepID=A0A7V8VGE9_9BACT|nr:rhodanese-like domain-containing protein [Thermogemmata fonticola]MBA2227563.1 sulfurtransferase [Thermogemmata fonticola]MCX8138963.1 rhodanese-like domain-containing protein [Gemmataceae bacterium]